MSSVNFDAIMESQAEKKEEEKGEEEEEEAQEEEEGTVSGMINFGR